MQYSRILLGSPKKRLVVRRHLWFLLGVLLSFGLFWEALGMLLRLSMQHDYYSHILVVPIVSAGLIYWVERKEIFVNVQTSLRGALALLTFGTALYWLAGGSSSATPNGNLSLTTLSIVIIWLGAFLFCYGAQAFRAAIFPLLFLLLIVPVPAFLLDKIIFGLQVVSSEASYGIFRAVGVPVFREGFLFYLPGILIEVAKECSGIRSSTALLILCLLLGHLSFRSRWRKACLFFAALPILIIKNALRIVTLSLLAVYVNPEILNSPLHQQGGILFFLLGLGILGFIIRLLQKSERKGRFLGRPGAGPRKPLAESSLT